MKKIIFLIALAFIISGCGQVSTSNNYKCSSNYYNCDDFSTHSEAQNVYESCGGIDNDVHELDRDGDGSACETLL